MTAEAKAATGAANALWSPAGSWSLREKEGHGIGNGKGGVKLLVRGCENKQKKHILKRKSDKRGRYRLGLFSAVVLLM